jgi:hypothetical protein
MASVYYYLKPKKGGGNLTDESGCRETLGRAYIRHLEYYTKGRKSNWDLIFGIAPHLNLEDTDKYCEIMNKQFLSGIKIGGHPVKLTPFLSDYNPKWGVQIPVCSQLLLSSFLYALRFPHWLTKVSNDSSKDDVIKALILNEEGNLSLSQKIRTFFYLYNLKDMFYKASPSVSIGPSDWIEDRTSYLKDGHHTPMGRELGKFVIKFGNEIKERKTDPKLGIHSYADFYISLAYEDKDIYKSAGLLVSPSRIERFKDFRNYFLKEVK